MCFYTDVVDNALEKSIQLSYMYGASLGLLNRLMRRSEIDFQIPYPQF